MIGLGLSRPQTGLMMPVILVPAFIVFARPSLRDLMRVAAMSIAGMIIFVLLTSILIESPVKSFNRIVAGIKYANILEAHASISSLPKQLTQVKYDLGRLLSGHYSSVVFMAFGFAGLSSATLFASKRNQRTLKVIAAGLAVGAALFWVYPYASKPAVLEAYSLEMASQIFTLVAAAIVFGALFISILGVAGKAGDNIWRVTGVAFILIWTQIAQTVFTGSNWVLFAGWLGLFPIMALFVLIRFDLRGGYVLKSLALASVLLTVQFGSYKYMKERPYRLAGTLTEQIVPTSIRGGKSILLTDMPTHSFLSKLNDIEKTLGPIEDRPYLIDVTGVSPFFYYLRTAV